MTIAEKIIILLILGAFLTIAYRWGKVVVIFQKYALSSSV